MIIFISKVWSKQFLVKKLTKKIVWVTPRSRYISGQFHQHLRANISPATIDAFFGKWCSANFGIILIENPSHRVFGEIDW
jgi:hypothetical protein